MEKLIYSKRYPKPDREEMNKELERAKKEGPSLRDREFIDSLFDRITYKEIPGRKEKSKVFVAAAIKVAEDGEYDIEIYEAEDKITVEFSFDLSRPLNDLKNHIIAADEIDALADKGGREVKLALYFFTKSSHLNGKQIAP